ncbi:riboflavin kinase / FMN adenylyltransferase [Novimethylophilus kurashikiensis]|uniref:Riboflavin biosynthesis protein n=1 Tax=Novimethylophilus kurashikiensis TaxID=1825523 RepID=A0A2R5F7J2_9PROT|nr:bifunctional riboflavin kinase/FAD synthetase [Novimethylophilus kurashikiensis]GBG14157.1 riboflavin kinase / FMN adenylyltransferase [Novimethylophilus kurashikiensis]
MMQILRHFPEHAEVPCALAIGNFDGVHIGHQAILKQLTKTAKALGMMSSVLTFEPHPREFFKPEAAPVRLASMREKLELFAKYGVERAIVCQFDGDFAAMSADNFIEDILRKSLDARLILVGEDFRFGAHRMGNVQSLRDAGCQVENLPDVEIEGVRVSSTAVRQALATGDLAQAKRLLGRDYSISGHVVHGDKVGRQLGYPTANVQMHHDKPPLTGIYAVKLAGLENKDLPGVASLGFRPTVKNNGKPTLEVHLFDFEGDLYGHHVQVKFLQKIRDEEKFPDLETLKRQIALDEQAARQYFLNEPI